MKRHGLYGASALVALALILTASFFFVSKSSEDEGAPVLRLAVYEWGGYSPAVYAQQAGLYASSGLRVELLKANSPAQMNEWFRDDKVDGICGVVLTDLLLLRSRGEPLQGVLLTDYSTDGDVIMSRSDLVTIGDLKGKRVSVDRRNSFSQVFVQRMLALHGLKESDVKWVERPFDQVPDALIRNEIDAGHTWSPAKEMGLKVSLKVLAKAEESPGIVMEVVAFRESLLNAHPEMIRAFTRVFFEAQKQVLENPLAAATRMKDFYGNDPVVFAGSFSSMHFFDLAANKDKFDGENTESVFATAKMINELLTNSHLVESGDLYRTALRPEFVQAQ